MKELQVIIPSNNVEERAYIIQVMLSDFLSIPYELVISDKCKDYTLIRENRKIFIKDAFFGKFEEPLSYLNRYNLPDKISWFTRTEDKIPLIFGEDLLRIGDDQIYCGLDIFASSFFMLTRWEECVIEKRDSFGRCDESEMFVVKYNLSDRPVVNEYCSLLRELLLRMEVDIPAAPGHFNAMITHDVDFLFRYGSLLSVGQNLAGDIINRKSLRTAALTISNYVDYKRGKVKDPFDTFDELMDISEKHGLKSSFFFKPSIPGEYDCTYSIFDKRVTNIITKIYKRGHEAGIHPSKNTFHNESQFNKEVNRIRSLDVPVFGGRQHFLLYDIPETFSYWEKANMEYDSGLGFSKNSGFRCGVCQPFKVFDIRQRKRLKLVEKPFSVMDAAFIPMKPEPDILYENILRIVNQVKKYSGLFVLLWHNDGFNRPESGKYKEVYTEVLKSL
jgi:hypothetical protein